MTDSFQSKYQPFLDVFSFWLLDTYSQCFFLVIEFQFILIRCSLTPHQNRLLPSVTKNGTKKALKRHQKGIKKASKRHQKATKRQQKGNKKAIKRQQKGFHEKKASLKVLKGSKTALKRLWKGFKRPLKGSKYSPTSF